MHEDGISRNDRHEAIHIFRRRNTDFHMSDGMADMALTATTNLEELANSGMLHLKRPRLLLFAVTFTAIFFVAGVQPLRAAIQLQFTPVLTVQERFGSVHLRRTTLTAEDISVAKAPIPPVAASILPYTCGDGKCESPAEDALDCLADCPGVTTPAMCGEEPHSDPGGEAVAWGITHKTLSAVSDAQRTRQSPQTRRSRATPGPSARCRSAGASTRATSTLLASAGSSGRSIQRTLSMVSEESTQNPSVARTGKCMRTIT